MTTDAKPPGDESYATSGSAVNSEEVDGYDWNVGVEVVHSAPNVSGEENYAEGITAVSSTVTKWSTGALIPLPTIW